MRRHLTHSHRWTPLRAPLVVRVNARQAWFLIAGAAATIVVLLLIVRAVA